MVGNWLPGLGPSAREMVGRGVDRRGRGAEPHGDWRPRPRRCRRRSDGGARITLGRLVQVAKRSHFTLLIHLDRQTEGTSAHQTDQ